MSIEIGVDEIKKAAAACGTAADEYKSQTAQVWNESQSLLGSWEGSAGAAFSTDVQSLKDRVYCPGENAAVTMKEILESAAASAETLCSDAASIAGAFCGGCTSSSVLKCDDHYADQAQSCAVEASNCLSEISGIVRYLSFSLSFETTCCDLGCYVLNSHITTDELTLQSISADLNRFRDSLRILIENLGAASDGLSNEPGLIVRGLSDSDKGSESDFERACQLFKREGNMYTQEEIALLCAVGKGIKSEMHALSDSYTPDKEQFLLLLQQKRFSNAEGENKAFLDELKSVQIAEASGSMPSGFSKALGIIVDAHGVTLGSGSALVARVTKSVDNAKEVTGLLKGVRGVPVVGLACGVIDADAAYQEEYARGFYLEEERRVSNAMAEAELAVAETLVLEGITAGLGVVGAGIGGILGTSVSPIAGSGVGAVLGQGLGIAAGSGISLVWAVWGDTVKDALLYRKGEDGRSAMDIIKDWHYDTFFSRQGIGSGAR